MRYTILLLAAASLFFAGCAHEKSFEVTGNMTQRQLRDAEAADARPTAVFPGPNRPVPQPSAEAPAPRKKQKAPEPVIEQSAASTQPPQVTVTPDSALTGKVVSVNANLRFVVLNFPIGQMAPVEKVLNVYRQGQKVGEVKVTGPQQDDNIIADVSTGEAQAGDEVREN